MTASWPTGLLTQYTRRMITLQRQVIGQRTGMGQEELSPVLYRSSQLGLAT